MIAAKAEQLTGGGSNGCPKKKSPVRGRRRSPSTSAIADHFHYPPSPAHPQGRTDNVQLGQLHASSSITPTFFPRFLIPSTTYKSSAPKPQIPHAISKVWQHKRPSTPNPRLPPPRSQPARAHHARTKPT